MFDPSDTKILLLQAEPALAELTALRLEMLGYKIDVAGDGRSAMDSIRKSLPDLIMVDPHLPDTDGIDWISRLRVQYRAQRLPVILLSLTPASETTDRAFHAGAQDCLSAASDPTLMQEKIETLLLHRHISRRR